MTIDDRHCKSDEEFHRLHSTAINFTGEPLGGKWVSPPLYSIYPRKPFPDIALLHRGGLVAYPSAFDAVDMFLEIAGELIPLKFGDKELTVCNIIESVECLDDQKSQWQVLPSGNRLFLKPYIDASLLPESTLFKIPQRPTSIYCWERHNDPEGEFKACYEKHKLKGLRFRLIQSSEE